MKIDFLNVNLTVNQFAIIFTLFMTIQSAEGSGLSDSALALDGGDPAYSDPGNLAFRNVPYGEEEIAAVVELLRGGGGLIYGEIERYQEALRGYFGSRHAVAMVNGTSALQAAAFALGVGEGDEVICPSYTYWASCTLVRAVGALPVFVDVDRATAVISPEQIVANLTPRTKAIVVVHLWGMPAEMDAIMAIAREHDLRVIEDASQAHGACYRGKKVGTIGDVGCFSTQQSKLLPTMEGGFLLTDDADFHAKALAFGHYGKVPVDHPWHRFNPTGMGFKHRIHPVAAVLGRLRLQKLDQVNREINRRIDSAKSRLAALPGIDVFPTPDHVDRVYFQFEIAYDEQVTGVSTERMMEALCAEGLGVAQERYALQHEQAIYREASLWPRPVALPEDLPVSRELHRQVLQLPGFRAVDDELVEAYVAGFEKVWRSLDRLRAMDSATSRSGATQTSCPASH